MILASDNILVRFTKSIISKRYAFHTQVNRFMQCSIFAVTCIFLALCYYPPAPSPPPAHCWSIPFTWKKNQIALLHLLRCIGAIQYSYRTLRNAKKHSIFFSSTLLLDHDVYRVTNSMMWIVVTIQNTLIHTLLHISLGHVLYTWRSWAHSK